MRWISCLVGSAACLFAMGRPIFAAGPDDVQLWLETHCVDCHGAPEGEGGFQLDPDPETWVRADILRVLQKAHRRIENGEMPPREYGSIEAGERAEFADSLRRELIRRGRALDEIAGRSPLRRLSRHEFAATVKDLLAMPNFELVDRLPADGMEDGFAKGSGALPFSHVVLNQYLQAVDAILQSAIDADVTPMRPRIIRGEMKSIDGVSDTLQTLRVQLKQTTAIPLVGTRRDPTLERSKGNFAKRDPGYIRDPAPHFDGVLTFMNSRANHNTTIKPFKVTRSGRYHIRVRGCGLRGDHGVIKPGRTETVAFYEPGGRLIGRVDVPPDRFATGQTTVYLNKGEDIRYLAVSTPNTNIQMPEKMTPKYERFDSYGLAIQWLELEGPLDADGPRESHRRLLGDTPVEPSGDRSKGSRNWRVVVDHPEQTARRLVRDFLTRAYRRPVTDADMDLPMAMFRDAFDGTPKVDRDADDAAKNRFSESFLESLLSAYRTILVSPGFLLVDQRPGRLDDDALATRLALFLTGAGPDADLRRAARRGEISDAQVLADQVDRLLDGPTSQRFVDHFLDYWLDLRNIDLTEPDDNLYPDYSALLGESMVEETRAFFAEMVRQNLGAEHVYDSDFLMINGPLARLYGIDGVEGSEVRRVPIPDDHVRGGLLTQASVLKITGNGTTTSPVVRGTFVMSRLLGDPPPPPPPSVPAIEPDITGASTIGELLARHRDDPACAMCHAKIDPPGFALESFDVMGRFRDRYRIMGDGRKRQSAKSVSPAKYFNGKPPRFVDGPPVDSAGELPGGLQFDDIRGFRDHLRGFEESIARHLLTNLVTYATGRAVTFADDAVIDQMMADLSDDNYGLRSMIHQIVQSPLFRNK